MEKHTGLFLLIVGALSGGCALDGAELESEGLFAAAEHGSLSGNQTVGPLPADSDLSEPPEGTISFTFSPSWSEHVRGPLFHGARVSLSVDPGRFPTCGTSGRTWAGVMSDDGDITEVALDGGEPGNYRYGEVELPTSGSEVQIWLWTERDDGCVEYDSDYDRNYRFSLVPWRPVRVRFNADWTEVVEGALEPGAVMVVDYDWDRLPECRINYRGFPSWEIIAHVRFDDGDVLPGQSVTRTGNWTESTVHPVLAVFPIPEDAHHVELWFENGQYPPTCRTWDSDYGNNYHFHF